MTSSSILSIVTFIYALAAFLYVAAWVFKKPLAGQTAVWVSLIGVAGNLGGIALRWRESYQMGIGHAPLSNLYESLIFFACVLTIIYLLIDRRTGSHVIGIFTAPLAFLAMAYASLSPQISDRIEPLIPALKSNWLIAHVITCFIGYSAFAVAFGLSIMYLIKNREGTTAAGSGTLASRLPETAVLDELTHRMILFGFLFLTVGIITGAVWANSAWGKYWSWDPKETWSLITWLIYATLLHARMMRGWHGKRIAVLSLIGFTAVLFTYFGVNLLPGLHSYGSPG